MVYVQRNAAGRISGIFVNLQEIYADEELPDNNIEVVEFLNPSPNETDYASAIQSFIDQTAQSKKYADGVTLASYKDSTVPLWAAQSAVFIAWRDAVWVYAYSELAKVQAGERPQPSVADFLLELPEIAWP